MSAFRRQCASLRTRRVVELGVAAIVALAFSVVPATPAFAHAELVSANPIPGAGLPQAPGAVVLKFSEPLNRELSHIEVVDRSGHLVTVGSTTAVIGDADAMQRKLGLLQPGPFVVHWTTVSSVDGHTLKGSYDFGIGDAPPGNEHVVSSAIDSEGWLGLIGSFIGFLGLAIWVGTAILGRTARRAGVDAQRLRRLELIGPPTAFVGAALMAVSSAIVARGSLSAVEGVLFSSRSGHWRVVVLIVAAGATLLSVGNRRWRRTFSGVLAIVAIVAIAASGHAGTTAHPLLATASLSVHLLAVGVWVFALASAALSSQRLRAVLAAFAPVAVGAAAAVVLTGVVNTILELNDPSELTRTWYGRLIVGKALALSLMVVFGISHNQRRRAATPDVRSMRDLVFGELGVAAAALVLAVMLVGIPNPPREDAVADRLSSTNPVSEVATKPAISVAEASGPFIVGLTVLPPRPGPIDIRVQVVGVEAGDALRHAVVHASTGSAHIDIPLATCGLGCLRGSGILPSSGSWHFATDFMTNRGPVHTSSALPLPAQDGAGLLRRTTNSMQRLNSARVHEELRTTEAATPSIADYTFQAPDAFSYFVVGGAAQITIGTHQYSRQSPTSPWINQTISADTRASGYRWPNGYYRGFWRGAQATRVLGRDVVDGVPSNIVGFVIPDLPAWFRLWIGDDGLVRRMEMRTEGHLMNHEYSDFNQPVILKPPT